MIADKKRKTIRKAAVRMFRILLLLFGITFLSFFLSYLSPGDPATIVLKQSGMMVSEEMLNQTREKMGLNDPMPQQYVRWLGNILRGDMGTSYKSRKPVFSQLRNAIPKTMLLTVVSMAVMILVATPTGILCARYKDGIFDQIVRAVTYLFSSLPSFFVALLILYFLALRLKLLPVIARTVFPGIIMPVLTLSLTLGAWYVRQIRSMVLAEKEKNYVKGLRTRGIPERRIFTGHILHNCMAPLITLFVMSFGSMLGGTAIVESIFAWNGVGKLAVDSISARDYPMIQGYVLWMALIFLVLNAVSDILCRCIDPRIRRERAV